MRARDGKDSAEDDLVRLFHKRVLTMTSSRVRDIETARDLTQEVLMAVILAIRQNRIREGEKLAAYVFGTARNLINGHFRSKPPDHLPLPQDLSTGGDFLENLHARFLMGRLLSSLDAADRRVLALALVEGLKPGEIARRLGLSSVAVRARKSRAIKKAIERFAGRRARRHMPGLDCLTPAAAPLSKLR